MMLLIHKSKLPLFGFLQSILFSLALSGIIATSLWKISYKVENTPPDIYIVSYLAIILAPIAVAAIYRYAVAEILSWLNDVTEAGVLVFRNGHTKEWLREHTKRLEILKAYS